ncbi:hypothetical protein AsAng_0061210 [Aureispira anguillae]|uniref:Uncharacterized protein n=1 Tax=Aureispira anguillae TaxID=2864201 RepID=A0A915YLX6_9BACT|nr:hypothetical protein AsAng_0061210 [Aureispira anguillae]
MTVVNSFFSTLPSPLCCSKENYLLLAQPNNNPLTILVY